MFIDENRKIRVLVTDDHQVVREGLAAILNEENNIAVVGFARDGIEAVAKARELSPDIVLMDISMPNMNGIGATQQIKKENPAIGVVILLMYAEEKYVISVTCPYCLIMFEDGLKDEGAFNDVNVKDIAEIVVSKNLNPPEFCGRCASGHQSVNAPNMPVVQMDY